MRDPLKSTYEIKGWVLPVNRWDYLHFFHIEGFYVPANNNTPAQPEKENHGTNS